MWWRAVHIAETSFARPAVRVQFGRTRSVAFLIGNSPIYAAVMIVRIVQQFTLLLWRQLATEMTGLLLLLLIIS